MQNKQTDMEKYQDIKESKLLRVVRTISYAMDKWCIDPLLGFIPYVGDLVTPIMSLPYLYISVFKLKSPTLTIAIIYNILVDCAIGLIPWLGNIFDFFNKSYIENLQLLEGYIENNKKAISTIRRKVAYLATMIFVLIAIIVALVLLIGKLLLWAGEAIYSWFV